MKKIFFIGIIALLVLVGCEEGVKIGSFDMSDAEGGKPIAVIEHQITWEEICPKPTSENYVFNCLNGHKIDRFGNGTKTYAIDCYLKNIDTEISCSSKSEELWGLKIWDIYSCVSEEGYEDAIHNCVMRLPEEMRDLEIVTGKEVR